MGWGYSCCICKVEPLPPVVTGPLSPVLEFIVDNGNGTYTAHWGYNNGNPNTPAVPIGPQNRFSGQDAPANGDFGQPTTFSPQRTVDVFTTTWSNGQLVWTLNGRTATADPANAI